MQVLNCEIVTTEDEIVMYHCEIDYLKILKILLKKIKKYFLKMLNLNRCYIT